MGIKQKEKVCCYPIARTPSRIFSSGIFSSLEIQILNIFVSCGNSPLYVRTLPSFRASIWKVLSVSLNRKETVSAFVDRFLKSSHFLHLTMTAGP